ncbi:hypothetical protein ACFQPA_21975 [Halomarina halobia]|uniref:hypothetical protein n=1 Tax=Halomarina halobia TaxID=3033386 RepID=UPI00362267AE
MFDYLAELVLLQELEGVAVSRAEGVEIEERGAGDGYALRATVAGPIGEPLFDVKSPTYSEARRARSDALDGTGERASDDARSDGATGRATRRGTTHREPRIDRPSGSSKPPSTSDRSRGTFCPSTDY